MLQIELYIREITRFLRTVTLKNVYFLEQMEENWVSDYFRGKLPDKYQPYYRHLNGEYILKDLSTFRRATGITAAQMSDDEVCEKYGLSLTVDIDGMNYPNIAVYKQFDELMMVNSADDVNHQPVPFTKSMLDNRENQKTASLYRIPSRYYSNICARYPKQVDLIKSIVYRIPSLYAAIKANNYDVISCDLTQLQENERSSMYACMIETLEVIKRRWDVPDFVYEELYPLSMQGKIWSVLLLALLKQRVVNIRTSAAHPYHIWEYLKSYGLEDYSDVLSLDQAVFLYRNFPYILRNRGTDFNLLLLAHKLLSDWNIQIEGKNLLQQTSEKDASGTLYMVDNYRTTEQSEKIDAPKPFPVIDSVVIGKTVLDNLHEVDRAEANHEYHNKTIKAADELKSFDYYQNDLQELVIGDVETLDEIYKKEQDAGLEYQDEYHFDKATKKQTRQFTYTPHTYLPTKVLEISRAVTSTLFQQIYARFFSESLLHRLSLGQGDYYISFIPDGMNHSINLLVKEAVALVIYCTLKEYGIYDQGTKLDRLVYLTVPYKTEFNPVSDVYKWNNIELTTAEMLNIVPTKLTLECSELPDIVKGTFTLSNSNDSKDKWQWANEDGATFGFKGTTNDKRWELTYQNHTLRCDTDVEYANQFKWHMDFVHNNISYSVSISVNEYDYVIDRYMPLRTPVSYTDLINLINEQAEGYIQIYRETHGSDLSRQHAAVDMVMDDRTFKGVVELDLLEGKTFEEFIENNSEIQELINHIESATPNMVPSRYTRLGNTIVKTLLPIESDYLLDNAGISASRFAQLKKLFISLCSYNVSFLEGDVGGDIASLTISSQITQDWLEGELHLDLKDYVSDLNINVVYEQSLSTPLECINIGEDWNMQPVTGTVFKSGCVESFIYADDEPRLIRFLGNVADISDLTDPIYVVVKTKDETGNPLAPDPKTLYYAKNRYGEYIYQPNLTRFVDGMIYYERVFEYNDGRQISMRPGDVVHDLSVDPEDSTKRKAYIWPGPGKDWTLFGQTGTTDTLFDCFVDSQTMSTDVETKSAHIASMRGTITRKEDERQVEYDEVETISDFAPVCNHLMTHYFVGERNQRPTPEPVPVRVKTRKNLKHPKISITTSWSWLSTE